MNNVNKEAQGPEFNQTIVDAVDLAGDINIFSPLVGCTFFKRLNNVLLGLAEPGILLIDFLRVGVVDSSALMISIGNLLAICQRNRWRRTIACLNTTPPIRATLQQAIIAQPYVDNPWTEAPQVHLLLCASDMRTKAWSLLGDLSERQAALWNALLEVKCVSVEELANRLGVSNEVIDSDVQMMQTNNVLLNLEGEPGVMCAFPALLTLTSGGEL